ncbi:MAG: hypothetical protein ABIE55_03190 [Candidatus Aenigmatarchaeota archaeon]
MEEKIEQHVETKPAASRRFDFRKWLEGNNKKEYVENISFAIIVISGVLVAMGIGIGSFVQGTILLGVLGAFFVMVGIVIYIISQFIEV